MDRWIGGCEVWIEDMDMVVGPSVELYLWDASTSLLNSILTTHLALSSYSLSRLPHKTISDLARSTRRALFYSRGPLSISKPAPFLNLTLPSQPHLSSSPQTHTQKP